MAERLSPASEEEDSVKLELDDENERAPGSIKREGHTAKEAIDVDNLVQLAETRIICSRDRIFEEVRSRYVVCLQQIIGAILYSHDLNARLEDAASFAKTADQTKFVSRHEELWGSYIQEALKEAALMMTSKKRRAAYEDGISNTTEAAAYRNLVLQPSCERNKTIEDNRSLTDKLVRDLKRHSKIPAPKKKQGDASALG